ncbi:MAG TPA: F0F1 ATP synthase subunit epsilon [Rhizomicrobium sp.]
MVDRIAFDLVSPERLLLSEEAEMVTVPGTEGEFGVLLGHEPVISTLRPGVIDMRGGTQGDARFFVQGGFVEVNPLKITVLAEEAIPMEQVDAGVLDQRIRNAEEDIHLAKTEGARARAVEILDTLRLMRAAL